MNSFEINKIIGALLGAVLFVMAIGFISDAIYAPITDKGPGYTLPEPEPEQAIAVAEAGVPAEPAEPELTLAALLADASADAGARVAKKCAACHTFDEGGGNKTGPNLWAIVGRAGATEEGFKYSDALVDLAAEQGPWTYEMLSGYVESPKTYAPGNKMAFVGVSKPVDRANLLAYLQTLSSAPVAFPTE